MADKKPAAYRPKSPEIEGGTDTVLPEDIQKEDDPIERGGPKGPEPTRFGDWENNGRCTDF